MPSTPTSPLLVVDVFTHAAFNDDFKRQQNSAVQQEQNVANERLKQYRCLLTDVIIR